MQIKNPDELITWNQTQALRKIGIFCSKLMTLKKGQAHKILSTYYGEVVHVPVDDQNTWSNKIEEALCIDGIEYVTELLNLNPKEAIKNVQEKYKKYRGY